VRSGAWERSRFVGAQLAGKTAGIVGFGTIGRIVAERCRALGMRVLAFDPFVTRERMAESEVEPCDLEALLAEADVVSLHCPVTEGTRGLMDASRLAGMKKGARLVNCARGELVVEEALVEALESGHLAGAALDVFAAEPPEGSPLLELDKVVLTPHLGASTREAQDAVALQVVHRVADYLLAGKVGHAVNLPGSGAASREEAAWGQLARRLGRLLSGLAPFAVETLEVGLMGDATELQDAAVASEALVGLLERRVESTAVNRVNAELIAERQGLSLVVSRSHELSEEVHGLVALEARAGECSVAVRGTLLADRHPRLVAIDDVFVETPLSGDLLITRHEDRPGVIGEIGTILGRRGVNIVRMNVGDRPGSGEALAVLAVERALEGEERRELEALAPLRSVVQARLG
jgi:D-3-phosphoglycerate dehydrogenase